MDPYKPFWISNVYLLYQFGGGQTRLPQTNKNKSLTWSTANKDVSSKTSDL